MAREVISASILIIATVVAASAAIMVIIPSIRDLSGSYTSLARNLNDKVETDVEIIFIMVNNSTSYVNVTFWVKNTGNTRICDALINRSDIFIYSDNKYLHFTPTDSEVSYAIENGDGDDYWEKSETLRFAIENLDTDSLPQGEYILTFVLYNGVETSDLFSW